MLAGSDDLRSAVAVCLRSLVASLCRDDINGNSAKINSAKINSAKTIKWN